MNKSTRLVHVDTTDLSKPFQSNNSIEEAAFLKGIRDGVLGAGATITTPFGTKPLRYFDFIASGRFHKDVEDEIAEKVLPFMANTHTEVNYTGKLMTGYYEKAFHRIGGYLNASVDDVLIPVGSGSTGAINRLITVLGLRMPESIRATASYEDCMTEIERPVIFRSMMEHHSNDIAWRESIGEMVYIEFNAEGTISLEDLVDKLEFYKDRRYKIGTFSAASNVTGILNDCHALANVLHKNEALAFFDFAAAGPYIDIDMHPEGDPEGYFDAIFLSIHKFLGGPRCPGLLVANKKLFTNLVPSEPGGGTVLFTSPWDHRYLSAIDDRETGGTPPIVQSIQAGLAFDLKAVMGAERTAGIEHDYVERACNAWKNNANIHILGNTEIPRLGVLSVVFKDVHHNLASSLFNDYFGIQVRGGCMCAGPYAHRLLKIDEKWSAQILSRVSTGSNGGRPGWVRISLSPTVSEEEFQVMLEAVDFIASKGKSYEDKYELVDETGEWVLK